MKRRLRSQLQLIRETFAELNYDTYQIHRQWMKRAISLAEIAGERGEIPVVALIVDERNNLIAQATNQKERTIDATAHAEILAIRAASQMQQSYYLQNCTLYVTLEPCPMCAGAIIQSRLGTLVYGADDCKTGAIRTTLNLPDSYCSNHRLKVLGGIQGDDCSKQLQTWFANRRKNK